MGDRAQVKIIGHTDACVYLYTHWGRYQLEDDIKSVLRREERWDDPEYLARMLFCLMVKGDMYGSTGYGIGTEQHGDIEMLITVDTQKEEVTVQFMYADTPDATYPMREYIDA